MEAFAVRIERMQGPTGASGGVCSAASRLLGWVCALAIVGAVAACVQTPVRDGSVRERTHIGKFDDSTVEPPPDGLRAGQRPKVEDVEAARQPARSREPLGSVLFGSAAYFPGRFLPIERGRIDQAFIQRQPFGTPPTTLPRRIAQGAITQLVTFDNSPFPFNGLSPASSDPFLNFQKDGRAAHRTARGRIYWADETYSERRSLLHVPAGFDIDRPAAIVLFFHGHGAQLERDVWRRYGTADQVSASGANVVLVASQFAVAANDSSIGHFWRPGRIAAYLDEAAEQLARMTSRPDKVSAFRNLPIIIVAYSGGFEAAGYALKAKEVNRRIQGIVLLDAAYGHLDTFARAIAQNRQRFLVSSWSATGRGNAKLSRLLRDLGAPLRDHMPKILQGGDVIVIHAPTPHANYVREAWTRDPLADVLRRITVLNMRSVTVASQSTRRR